MTILGLIISSASSFWLLVHEINSRVKRAARQQQIARILYQLAAHKRSIKETIENVAQVNATLGHGAYSAERETARTRANLEAAQAELDKLTDPDEAVLREMPEIAHLGGFLLLLVGFVLQLAAEIMKATH